MKSLINQIKRFPRQLGLALLFCLLVGMYAQAAAPAPAAPVKAHEIALVKSEFVDNATSGKDPFFPNTTRRQVQDTPTVVEPSGPSVKLRLQGVSGSKDKPLAIINNRTFGIGEEVEMKVESQAARVRCVEIRPRSAMVSINGQAPYEIFLSKTL